jgi:hypothetical protein
MIKIAKIYMTHSSIRYQYRVIFYQYRRYQPILVDTIDTVDISRYQYRVILTITVRNTARQLLKYRVCHMWYCRNAYKKLLKYIVCIFI